MQNLLSIRVLNAEETCDALRISRSTLWRLIRRGYLRQLKGFRVVRIPETEIQRYLKQLEADRARQEAMRRCR
jgi:excisionase family DNA binding protein